MNAHPSPEDHVIPLVVTPGPPKTSREPDAKRSLASRLLEVSIAICATASIGLLIGAIARWEIASLPWMLVSIAFWGSGYILLSLAQRRRVRDESLVVRVDRLRETTAATYTHAMKNNKRRFAWLTDSGIYRNNLTHIAWSECESFRIDLPRAETIRLALWNTARIRRRRSATVGLVLGCFLLGAVIPLAIGVSGLLQIRHVRNDTLALVFTGLGQLLAIVYILQYLGNHQRRRRPSGQEMPDFVAYIDTRDMTGDDATRFLARHLPHQV